MIPNYTLFMKRFHIALGVKDIEESVAFYTKKLGCDPVCVVENRYALFVNDFVNFSISLDKDNPGKLRHVGIEDDFVTEFSSKFDINKIEWESFNKEQQIDEIKEKFNNVKFFDHDTK